MFIKKLYIKNFKSFKEQEIELGNFNVLIGANASGKSNFVQVFEFLKSLPEENLLDAISMQGGFDYLRNLKSEREEEVKIKIEGLLDTSKLKKSYIFFDINFTRYDVKNNPSVSYEIKFSKNSFLKFSEELNININFKEISKTAGEKNDEPIKLVIKILNTNKDVSYDVISSDDGKINSENIKSRLKEVLELYVNLKTELVLILILNLLEAPAGFPYNISKYNLDPKTIKLASSIKGKSKLEEDGKNLNIILKNLLEDENNRQKFFGLVKFVLPFIRNFDFEIAPTKSVLLKINETFLPENYLPANFISDGTVNILALIVALYFEGERIQIFEEPEKNIHPYLISKVIEMMKDVSQDKQIIVTTHNPEVVKYVDKENLLLIFRNKEGFSEIIRPANKKEIKIFLENQIGLDELFVQNLLEL